VRFQGRTAVITGGASGIGEAAARAFAAEGAQVVILDIEEVLAQNVESSIEGAGQKCASFACDISKVANIEKVFEQIISRFKRVDFLFNNAGSELVKPLHETTEDDYDLIVDTNLKGTFFLSKLVVQNMAGTGGGVIINNSSDAGLRGIHWGAAYSTSKAGIIHLTRSIALDYAAAGVRCNCICPGCIRTPLCERFNAEVGARRGKTGEAVLEEFVDANIPMKRVGTPEEVASVVLFLCSDDARYVTGAIIPIDGGLTAGI
jgi:NAD(P)-dependent dehydrogenase (short-subunit alcohol dehydrogenase family)